MKTLDLKKMKLPLTKEKFRKLRMAIQSGQVKWMDMSKDLMFAYQDFWKSIRVENLNERI
ncbi:hypothetical protein SAMN04488111_2900 [Lutibacter flavus]|uniref:Uncharacterized protein n=1 Tax=Lutibacter flavus TaxID=691689 RepID=A0A238YY46_9FLAO|nr:hypothetical protein SAMN04488111_2900 [Lutibacter flavus]